MQIVGGAVTTALGGGGISSFFAWLGGRKKTEAEAKAYAQGAVDHAVKIALSGMETVVTNLKGEVERLSGDVAAGRAHQESCERDLRQVRNDLDEVKRDRDRRKEEIDRLMGGPVAASFEQAPK